MAKGRFLVGVAGEPFSLWLSLMLPELNIALPLRRRPREVPILLAVDGIRACPDRAILSLAVDGMRAWLLFRLNGAERSGLMGDSCSSQSSS